MEKYSWLLDHDTGRYKKNIYRFAAIGFLLGILVANTIGKKVIMELGIFGDYFFLQVETTTIKNTAMFWYVFEKRMFFILFIMLLSVTSMGNIIVYTTAGWIGLGGGCLMSAAAMQQGMKGIGICIAGLLPHYLLYVPASIILLMKACQVSGRIHGKEQRYPCNVKKELTTFLLVALGVCCIFFLGILLESFLSPMILQKIYKFFNNI